MKAILFDANLCVGCGSCGEACAEQNDLPGPEDAAPGLNSDRFTNLEERGDWYLRRMCMHCVHPSCASACPVGALHKTAAGPVVYDFEKCLGCRYCMVACPFSVPRYEWSSLTPRVRKCQMCPDRLAAGKQTACAEACPAEATMFGEREEMIALAEKRIADGGDEYSPHIYGLEEAGGTCVLVIGSPEIMDTAFDPRVPLESVPEKTWVVLSKIPTAVGVAGVGLVSLNWIIRRRMRLMNAEVASGNGRGNR